MSALIQEPPRRRRFTVDDYHRMAEVGIFTEDDRVELIEGEIFETTPIGSPHAGRVNRLTAMLVHAVGNRAVVAAQNPVALGERSEPQPDIALLRPRADFYKDASPVAADVLLLIEVADASLETDRDIKVPLYARHGIPEVWIVDIPHRQVLRFAVPEAGGYREHGPVDLACPVALPGLPGLPGCAVALRALF